MKYADLNALSDEQLVHQELRLERELLSTQFSLKTGQLDDSSKPAVLRKGIARARTAQRARELEQGLGKNALRDRHRTSFDPSSDAPAAEQDSGSSSGFLQGIADRLGLGGESASAE